ncbi:DUF1045 domain-containing protein [Aurantimonas sp. C2-6-R+9]|uniref:DUF1045 domain-containing protein n=1 Tax=unclassified Aurantimonas TaxID=2638230 RepID=UPI002E1779D9|nr:MULTISPECIES: DUF1045 domain-containing protein [unclassified Aurantimonas]MEC5292295.1 DUF1045 domain-containing protein [Aurantimonas sp. C2-3-R2]MEC5382509.1 DUF1045 domain-containing protein [Aurantimonas sp. C2-6-R+9]MEC5413380.1 DUF1045 domain-containing protein [Aurantimonas sp. C2-4-R8]
MRAAIFFTPPASAALTRAAAQWLGRGVFDGEPTRDSDPAIDTLVAEPARYGFHATMKAPFRFADGAGLADLDASLADFCASRDPVAIDRLVIAALGPFFAFVPERSPPALDELAEAVVRNFDAWRAPLTDAEYRRRRPDRLSERQRENLEQWGYPHVLRDFRFHMTLTGPVEPDERAGVEARLRQRFADFDGAPLAVDRLGIFIEREPCAPFRLYSLHPFRPRAEDALT